MREPSMTCVLALSRDFDGKLSTYLGIDFPKVGGFPVSEIVRRKDDLFDIVFRKTLSAQPRVCASKPFFVGVLQISGRTQRLDFLPI